MASGHEEASRESRLETINAFLIRTYNPAVTKGFENLVEEASLTMEHSASTGRRIEEHFIANTDKTEQDSEESQCFSKRVATKKSSSQPNSPQDLVCFDLEPRARFYYVHVLAKPTK